MLEAPAIIGIAVIIVLLILLWGRTGAGSEEDVFYDPSDGERQPHKIEEPGRAILISSLKETLSLKASCILVTAEPSQSLMCP